MLFLFILMETIVAKNEGSFFQIGQSIFVIFQANKRKSEEKEAPQSLNYASDCIPVLLKSHHKQIIFLAKN